MRADSRDGAPRRRSPLRQQRPDRSGERRHGDRPGFVARQAGERERRTPTMPATDAARLGAVRASTSQSHHAISSATDDDVSAMSSGSVIGVACRYSTFGFEREHRGAGDAGRSAIR